MYQYTFSTEGTIHHDRITGQRYDGPANIYIEIQNYTLIFATLQFVNEKSQEGRCTWQHSQQEWLTLLSKDDNAIEFQGITKSCMLSVLTVWPVYATQDDSTYSKIHYSHSCMHSTKACSSKTNWFYYYITLHNKSTPVPMHNQYMAISLTSLLVFLGYHSSLAISNS